MMQTRNDRLIREIRRQVATAPGFEALLTRLGNGERLDLTGATPEARALYLTSIQERLARRVAVVVPGDADLRDLELALRLLHDDPDRISVYPNPSLSPYQDVAPSLAVQRDEIRALGHLVSKSADILLIPARALFRKLPPPEDLRARTLQIREGADLDLRQLLQLLLENGFNRTDLVGDVGDFAFRGGILDLFPPNADQPLRIELFGDTAESIREFDRETQRSGARLEMLVIEPVSQFQSTPEVRRAIARKMSIDFNDPHYKRDLAARVELLHEHATVPGLENLLPMVLPAVSVPDYLPAEEWVITAVEPDEITSSLSRYESLLRSEFEHEAEKGKAVYAPHVLLTPSETIHTFLGRVSLAFSAVHIHSPEFGEVRLPTRPADRYVNRLTELAADLADGHNKGRKQLLFVATKGGREKIERLLRELSVPFIDDGDHLGDELVVTHGQLSRGFDFAEGQLSILSEWDLFEPPTSSRVGGRKKASEAFVTDLRDLKAGDFIVHVDHGVGRFRGLQRIAFGENEREVMELEYSSAGKLLLPMESLNLIQKYSGGGDGQPKLDKLGGTSWGKTKASVRKALRDMADELLKLYATRRMVPGHAFSKDSPWQFDFEDAFEFDETDDQLSAIEDVKADMESRKPMDRLLCGDVGYGKTEVAMRAAFKSVMDGKQVAVLAPTTILAYQHYRTFLRRFASFPLTIELSSRFRSPKEQKAIARKISDGEIDVVIGTHRILSKDMNFKDLGLLVIDEEQRFGVAQKEKLKQFKKAIDVLAMSATPIPRTLHMSLVGIRDISVIETPPKDRLAIQTAVVPFGDAFIREAIEFELARGGQIFFVHNRVDSIYQIKEYLETLLPGLRVIVGHGQMDEQELEKAMMAFIGREYDVLLATTIIENGIDIPSCNTILINHAERFGLSQLYQLRGRVGRSDRLAFCYLLVPSQHVLTSEARQRLSAIQEFSDLGAGFRIAARDLEIRGSGNILGGEQSGQIAAVGFEMYCRLLEETVKEMKGEKVEEEIDTSINLGVDIYIPHDYIEDENLRLSFYKKIASAKDDKRLDDLRLEIRDRFGAIPASVDALLQFIRLKRLAQEIGLVSIVRDAQTVVMKFHQRARIDPNRLFEIVQSDPEARFTPGGALSLPRSERGRELIDSVIDLLSGIRAVA